MKVLPLTPAQKAHKAKYKIAQQKLDGSTNTMPNRIMYWLAYHGKLRYTQLAELELKHRQDTKWESDSFTSIGNDIRNLNPHFNSLLSDMQINGHIQKVLDENIKYYTIPL